MDYIILQRDKHALITTRMRIFAVCLTKIFGKEAIADV
jgi:hypothetical protein